MASIDRAFIDQVLSSTDIVELIKERVNLTKNGNNYKGLCPFHNEKTPSFNVSSTKQFYHCFGCGASGDAIKFLQEYEHLTFIEALSKLAQSANIQLPDKTKKNDDSYNLFISNKLAAEIYNKNLLNNSTALSYLSERNIDQEMIENFQLGLADNSWDSLTKFFAEKNILKNAIQAGLVISSNNKTYDRFRSRIIFPIKNSAGNIIGFGGRIYNTKDGAKYLNSPETKLFHKSYELYGLFESKKSISKEEEVIVVEGYTDVIGLHKAGIKNCIATLGTAFTKFHFKKIKKYTNKIIFCFDGDSAGISAAWKAINNCMEELDDETQIFISFLPEGFDPDSFVQNDKNKFIDLISSAKPLSEYIIEHLKSGIKIDTVEGKTAFANRAKNILNIMPTIMYTDILKKEFETIIGDKILSKDNAPVKKHVENENMSEDIFDVKESTLISLLIEYPRLINSIDFEKVISDPLLIEIYNAVKEGFSHNENFKAASLINVFPDNKRVQNLMTFKSNESSEESALLTAKDILSQLEKTSDERLYFNLLNRYTDGEKLSDDERAFIKNFKK
ncbi:MAG: DNA primase [Gammaproteobacteria bacterium]